jgi:putative flippase GtrA
MNRAKGASLRTGFVHASGDYVGIQDADLEYDPLQYRLLLTPILEDRADVVYGSRYLQTAKRRVLYFWHTWMNKTLTTVSNMFTNLDITDMETCYKLFKREIIQSIDLYEDRFGFEPEVTAKISQIRCRIYECAINYSPRTFEEGKKINWKDGVWALYCILHYGAHSAPLPMQFVIYFIIGAVCAVVNVVLFSVLYNSAIPIGWAIATAFVVAAALNYLLCILILFRHKARWKTGGEIIAYIATISIMGLLDYGITVGLTGLGLVPTFSKILAVAGGLFGNFVLRRFLVFPERRVVRI